MKLPGHFTYLKQTYFTFVCQNIAAIRLTLIVRSCSNGRNLHATIQGSEHTSRQTTTTFFFRFFSALTLLIQQYRDAN